VSDGLGDTIPVGSFEEAVAFLEQGIDYEKTRHWQYDTRWLKLDRVRDFLAAMDNPHLRYRVIHVAGTKGKGTTAGAAARCLTGCGARTGLLTSPHLVTVRERVRMDGRMIGEAEFTRIVRMIQPYVERKRRQDTPQGHETPTYFEMLTVLAFEHFAETDADWAVVEVGLGGRLDSTNVVRPSCCVITAIGMDHIDKLGDTPEAIAGEKAGILKDGVPLVLGAQPYPAARDALRRAAAEHECPIWEVGRDLVVGWKEPLVAPASSPEAPVGWRFGLETPRHSYADLRTPLVGEHQLANLAAAVGAVELATEGADLELDPARVAAALAEFTAPGRVELLQRSPGLVLDVAHTVESVQALLAACETHLPGRALHVVFGCSADKNVRGMLGLLRGRCASFTAVQAGLPRALPAEQVVEVARAYQVAPEGEIRLIRDAWDAARDALARARPEDVVCATGSFYTAGEIRARWRELHPEVRE